jgi:hypothetical protein
MADDKLEQLKQLLAAVNNSITKQEFAVSFKSVYDFVRKMKDHNDVEWKAMQSQFEGLAKSLQGSSSQEFSALKANADTVLKDCMAEMMVEHNAKMQAVDRQMATVRSGIDGLDGKDADEKKVVAEVLKQIPPVEIEPLNIVELLESLTGDQRLDASAVKNLPMGGKGGGSPKSLRWLNDITNAHEATDGQVLVANGDNSYTFEDAGTGSGVDTANSPNANEFARFTDADTIEGLTVAETLTALGFTASITELNYTDGVTSAIQAQIDGKLASSFTKAQLDTAVSDGNVLYVGDITGNATHTGEVTGATALTVDKTAITNKSEVSAAVGDYMLIADASDSSNLKKVTVQTVVDLASGSGVSESLAIAYAVAL